MSRARAGFAALALAGLAVGCTQQQMDDQPKYETFEPAALFPQGASARPLPPGTVARGAPLEPVAEAMPLPLTRALLEHGRDRFNIYCAPCHGRAGDGEGMIVQRGFPQPPSYHSARLRAAPDRHFYDVISEGYGVMYAYGARVPPEDRWAIVAWIRALQLSQHTPVSRLADEDRRALEGSPP